MLRLPGSDEEVPPLVIPGHVAESHSDDQGAAVSTQPDEFGRVKKRRRSNRKKDQVFDETFAGKKNVSPKLVRGLIGSVGLFGVILLVALLWPNGDGPDPEEGLVSVPVAVETVEPEKDKLQIEAERSVVHPRVINEEILPIYLKFLNAESPEEMARWVRHPDLTLPRIRKFYGEGFAPDGFSSILWSKPLMRIGDAIKATIQDGSFVNREIYVVDEDGWKVDWESWAGWSEMNWDEFKKSRTSEKVMFRVVVSDVSYYNFAFVDESRWSSYRLESADGERALYGYAPRAGVLDARLKSLEGIKNRPFVVKLRYPDEAPSDNQVLVEEIIEEGWFAPDDPS